MLQIGTLIKRLGEFALHAIARPGDQEDMAVVQQAVQDGRGNDLITTEDAAPPVERDVGRDDDRRPRVHAVDQLEERVRAAGIPCCLLVGVTRR